MWTAQTIANAFVARWNGGEGMDAVFRAKEAEYLAAGWSKENVDRLIEAKRAEAEQLVRKLGQMEEEEEGDAADGKDDKESKV